MVARGLAAVLLLAHMVAQTHADDVDCTMGSWSPWSKCTEDCDCGLTQRVRDVVSEPQGNGKKCDHDAEAQTCNCDDCTDGDKADDPPSLLPAASAHGYMNKLYAPAGGFPTDFGEQGACVLDKAGALLDLVPAFFKCDKWDGTVGEACFAESIDHLAKHTDACCEGREHFVLWQSDTFCEKRVAVFTRRLRAFGANHFAKCIAGDAAACAGLRSEAIFGTMANILTLALSTARDLYGKGKPADQTPAAKAFLKVCVPTVTPGNWPALKASMFGSGASTKTLAALDAEVQLVRAQGKCVASIKSFASEYTGDAIAKPNTRRRLRRGAVAGDETSE